MDLRTKLATAFTMTVVAGVVGWSATDSYARNRLRELFGLFEPVREDWTVHRDAREILEQTEHIHRPTRCNVKLVIDPTLASDPAPTGRSGRFGKGTGPSVAKSAFEIRCSAREQKDGSVALWVWLGTWSANEWFEFAIAPTVRAGSMLTAETECFLDIQKIGVDHGDQIRGCPFFRIEGTLSLRHVPMVVGERVPFELALRVDEDGGGFDWAVETAAEVLVER